MNEEFHFSNNISREELNKLPLIAFKGGVHIIDSYKSLKKTLPGIYKNKILGFDTETRPSFKKGVINDTALVQLASKEEAYLVRINKIGFPDEIKEILSDRTIMKVGAAIRDDLNDLKKIKEFEPESFIDLHDYSRAYGLELVSLRKMSGIVLGARISKGQQLSNWENDQLTIAQIKYAATDAWVSLKIYESLKQSL